MPSINEDKEFVRRFYPRTAQDGALAVPVNKLWAKLGAEFLVAGDVDPYDEFGKFIATEAEGLARLMDARNPDEDSA